MKFLGEIYREYVLTRDDLELREFSPCAGRVSVGNDLFGWKLECDGEEIRCRSEWEARYLRVLLDAGMTEIAVPNDVAFLAQLVPDLERRKKRIDEVFENYCLGIRDRRAKAQIRMKVYKSVIE